MREILITKRFKKDLKKAKNNPRQDTDRLLSAIEVLATHGILSEDFLPHCLSGNWKPKWECHIQPNFLLIYLAMYKPQVASILPLKTRREYILVALATAPLLSTVLRNKMKTTLKLCNLLFVNGHINLGYVTVKC